MISFPTAAPPFGPGLIVPLTCTGRRIVPLPASVPLAPMLTFPAGAFDIVPRTCSVPPVTDVAPSYVAEPESVSEPAPVFAKPPPGPAAAPSASGCPPTR